VRQLAFAGEQIQSIGTKTGVDVTSQNKKVSTRSTDKYITKHTYNLELKITH
jgi:hypothetical protein